MATSQHSVTVDIIVPCFFCMLSLFTIKGLEKWN